jgi:hypothetical protein
MSRTVTATKERAMRLPAILLDALSAVFVAAPVAPAGAQAPTNPPETACIMPEARSLLPEGEFDQLVTRVTNLGLGPTRTLYVGTSWLPSDGRLFAVSCAGKAMEEEMIGYIRRIEAGPTLPRFGRTLLVVATTYQQPNSQEDTFKLVAFRQGKFLTLLEHNALNRITAPAKDAMEEAWSWTFSPDGTRIEFGGTRTIPAQGNRPARREALPKDAYCWGQTEFAKCD